MDRYVLNPDIANMDFAEDAQDIVDKLADIGISISVSEAHAAWKRRSEAMCSEWLSLPLTPEDMLLDIENYISPAAKPLSEPKKKRGFWPSWFSLVKPTKD